MKNKKDKKSKERTKARINRLIQLKQYQQGFIKNVIAEYKKDEQARKIEALREKILEEGVLTNVSTNYNE